MWQTKGEAYEYEQIKVMNQDTWVYGSAKCLRNDLRREILNQNMPTAVEIKIGRERMV